MNVKLVKISLLAFCVSFFAVHKASANESAMMADLNSAFSSGSFPVVVDLCNRFEASYPSSFYLEKVLAYKGESLFNLSKFSEGRDVLLKAVQLSDKDNITHIRSLYYLGRCESSLGKYEKALSYYYSLCSSSFDSKKVRHYKNMSYFYAGECYFNLGNFKEAVPVLEKVIQDGYMDIENYKNAFRMLFESYLELNENNTLITVYKNFENKKFDDYYEDLYYLLTLHAGTAYERTGQYKNAYNCYKIVLDQEDTLLSSLALQKIYFVTSSHPKELGLPSDDVFETAKENLAEYPEMLCEFWTRLGIDAFNSGNMTEAKKYFEEAEKNDEENKFIPVIGLYRAKMIPESYPEILEKYRTLSGITKTHEYYGEYEIALAEFYCSLEKWSLCYDHAKNAMNINASRLLRSKAVLYQNLALYNLSKYADCIKTHELNKNLFVSDNEVSRIENIVYAKSLAKSSRAEDAAVVFESLLKEGKLTQEEIADYSALLFTCGYMSKTLETVSLTSSVESEYIKGLVAFNRGDWKTAEKLFSSYSEKSRNDYRKNCSKFYLGYSLYKQQKYEKALAVITGFVFVNPKGAMSWDGYVTGANCAVMLRRFDVASNMAENAITVSSTKEQKEKAVLLCASCYEDAGEINYAIETLLPYTKDRSEFSVRCRYQSAVLYAKSGNTDKADLIFKNIQENFRTSPVADESCYRRGELFYSRKMYSQAIERFKEYQKLFPRGQFIAASYYYYADSCHSMGEDTKALANYELLVQTFETSEKDSAYVVSARKNLSQIYFNEKKYAEAKQQLEKILETDINDSERKELQSQIAFINSSSKGSLSEIDSLKMAFERVGAKTEEGRTTGTALVKKLWENEHTKMQASQTAAKILNELKNVKEPSQTDCHNGVSNAIVRGQYERQNRNFSDAAEAYLEGAKYARMCGEDEAAQRCLYGAAESFDVAGKYGDAKMAASKLKELYPDSSYAKNAEEFLK